MSGRVTIIADMGTVAAKQVVIKTIFLVADMHRSALRVACVSCTSCRVTTIADMDAVAAKLVVSKMIFPRLSMRIDSCMPFVLHAG